MHFMLGQSHENIIVVSALLIPYDVGLLIALHGMLQWEAMLQLNVKDHFYNNWIGTQFKQWKEAAASAGIPACHFIHSNLSNKAKGVQGFSMREWCMSFVAAMFVLCRWSKTLKQQVSKEAAAEQLEVLVAMFFQQDVMHVPLDTEVDEVEWGAGLPLAKQALPLQAGMVQLNSLLPHFPSLLNVCKKGKDLPGA